VENRIDQLVGDVAERHHGVFGAHHLDALGVAVHERHYRLRTGRWIRVHDGAYRFAGAPLTWAGKVLAACWAGGRRAVASHRTAAELWELPGRDPTLVELTCPHRLRARHDGLLVHESRQLDPVDVTVRHCIPVTTVARTLFDLVAVLGDVTVDVAIDTALRRGLTTLPELRAVLERMGSRGRAGTPKFRALLAERGVGAKVPESEAESRLLRLLARRGLPRPAVQYEIRAADGSLVARVDFAYPDLRIAIEYDSYEHHVGKAALVRDGARRNAVASLGWLPITATAADLRDGARRLAAEIHRARALRSDVETRE
jgi:very-short-patch-repair endonuclease